MKSPKILEKLVDQQSTYMCYCMFTWLAKYYNLFGKAMQFPANFFINLFLLLLYAITFFSNYYVL